MPYIAPADRYPYDAIVVDLADKLADQAPRLIPGHLNYCVTRLLLLLSHGAGYHEWNELVGVLECAKLELYRRQIGPYENSKAKENGDVL